MQEMIVARRYAQGIALEAQGLGRVEQVAKGLSFFAQAMQKGSAFYDLMANPAFRKSEREQVVRELVSAGSFEAVMVNVLLVLIEKERMLLLPAINEAYVKIIDDVLGQVRAVVSSARVLDSSTQENIFQALEKMLARKIIATNEQDASLLGGVKVEIDGLILDGTIKGSLELLERNMVNGL